MSKPEQNPNFPMPEELEGITIKYDAETYAAMSAAIDLARLMGKISELPYPPSIHTVILKREMDGRVQLDFKAS